MSEQEIQNNSSNNPHKEPIDYKLLKNRFRGYYPVIIDLETAGVNPQTDALLELAAITLKMDENGDLQPDKTYHCNIEPFQGANIDPNALKFTGIDIDNPLRGAISENQAITEMFQMVRQGQKEAECTRSIIVAHNATFDQSFLNEAIKRTGIKRNPFHPFTTFDTATLAGLMLGQTVLAKSCQYAGIAFDHKQAHSALYDTERTAELFCYFVNRLKALGGFPLKSKD